MRRSGTALAFGTVATGGIADAAVTRAKLSNGGALSVIGRSANSSGVPADISASAASGAVLRESGSAIGFGTVATAGIADDAITNAKLANMAANTIKGRITASTGDPEDLTAANLKTILALVQADISGLTTASSPQFAGLNVGHASDTLLARASAGKLSVSGIVLALLTDIREKLTGARTYYVRTDGNDSNTGLVNNSGGAFLTIQAAWNAILQIDQNGYTVTIQIGDGTYTAGLLTSQVPTGPIVIVGNVTTPSNVVISTTAAACFGIICPAVVSLKSMRLQTTTSGSCVNAANGAHITTEALNYHTCAGSHVYAEAGAIVINGANYTITGGAVNHIRSLLGGIINFYGGTATSTGTFSFSTAFAEADTVSCMQALTTFTGGTITGKRYQCTMGGVIQTYGGGASKFPGSVAGTTATGGQYA